MHKGGPIIIIEDDPDDQYLIGEVFKRIDCNNAIVFLQRREEVFAYLGRADVQPFLIISDMNLSGATGQELREAIFMDELLRSKCVPYLFFTTDASPTAISDAYGQSVQGFFRKPNSFNEMESLFRSTLAYWNNCFASHHTT